MTKSGRKRLMWMLNAVLALALAGSCVYAVLPLAQAPPPQGGPRAQPDGPPDGTQAAPPPEAYAVIYRRDLRQPLQDRPVGPGPTTAEAAPASLRLVLLGTVVEPGNNFAIFALPNGTTRSIAVGESLEGAELRGVTSATATVRHLGKDVVLRVQKEVRPT